MHSKQIEDRTCLCVREKMVLDLPPPAPPATFFCPLFTTIVGIVGIVGTRLSRRVQGRMNRKKNQY